jgi:predicted nucleic acid-binding protein
MLVAACALGEGLVLATRNVRDFEGCGLTLENPFER